MLTLRVIVAISTAYCSSSGSVMADGTHPRRGSVASNAYPLGTRIRVSPPFFGRRRFVVRDRIGCCSQLDFYDKSCSRARRWGRRTIRLRVVSR